MPTTVWFEAYFVILLKGNENTRNLSKLQRCGTLLYLQTCQHSFFLGRSQMFPFSVGWEKSQNSNPLPSVVHLGPYNLWLWEYIVKLGDFFSSGIVSINLSKKENTYY